MLTDKCWKPDAIVRLLLSLFICVCAGSIVSVLIHYMGGGHRPNASLIALVAGALILLGAALVFARRSWTLENFMRRTLLVLGLFYAGIILGAFEQKLTGPLPSTSSTTETVLAALSIQGAGLILIGLFVQEHRISWAEAFGFNIGWGHAALYGIILACIFLPIGWLLQQFSYLVMTRVPHFPIQPSEQQAVQTIRHATTWADRVALATVTILIAPVAEEMLFRGILYPAIKQAGYPRLALWSTAVIFATVHFTPVIFLPLLALALLLVGLYELTGNLAAPITAHSLFNCLNFAMVYILDNGSG